MNEVYEISKETNALSKDVLDTCFYVHTHLGPGLLESVYEEALFYFLNKKGILVERQKILPVKIEDFTIPTGLKLDLLVGDQLVLELKAVEKLLPVHEAQLQTYLKLSGKPLGLLINFNVKSLKDGIKRIAMSQNQKKNFV